MQRNNPPYTKNLSAEFEKRLLRNPRIVDFSKEPDEKKLTRAQEMVQQIVKKGL